MEPQAATPTPERRARFPRYESDEPCLVFSPLAWLKLQLFLHAGDTEVGGFGVSDERDPLYLRDFCTVRQSTTPVTVSFDDEAVADYFDAAVDAGLTPDRFARVWVHTHPGDSPLPSSTDEETFQRVFGGCDWSVMFILSRTGRAYARLAFRAGPGGELLLPVAVDWSAWPQVVFEHHQELAGMLLAWAQEFGANVHPDADRFPRPADPGWVEWDEGQASDGRVVFEEDGDDYALFRELWGEGGAFRGQGEQRKTEEVNP